MALAWRNNPKTYVGRLSLLKRLFWLYFFLLIFEGALRKWVAPQFAAPLLIIRDPVSLWIIWEAYRTRKWPARWSSITALLAFAMIGLFIWQVVGGDNQWYVGVYGLRSYLLPFPVAFVMGENIEAEDLQKFGSCTLWLFLPLMVLSVAQYLAPAGSILNAGAGRGAGQIGSSGGHIRASATFSFVTGWATYIWLTAAFIFYGLSNKKFAKGWLLWTASFALVISIPVSGSRTVAFEMAALLLCVCIGALFGVSQFAKSLKILAPIVVIFFLFSFLPVFNDATATFTDRFAAASSAEGNSQATLLSRVIEPIVSALQDAFVANNWIGLGIGYGSNVASTLLTGTTTFLAGEGEISRVLGEFGLPLGLAFLLLRWSLAVTIAGKALSRLRDHETLAWLLVPLSFTGLAIATLEQPTAQGFTVIGIAFSLAALKRTEIDTNQVLVLNPPLGPHASRFAWRDTEREKTGKQRIEGALPLRLRDDSTVKRTRQRRGGC